MLWIGGTQFSYVAQILILQQSEDFVISFYDIIGQLYKVI